MMTPEERKSYNKEYYSKNKQRILEKSSQKIKCEFCNREIISGNYRRHINTPICERVFNENIKKREKLLLLRKTMEEDLEKKVETLISSIQNINKADEDV
jgi:hypothetical protein